MNYGTFFGLLIIGAVGFGIGIWLMIGFMRRYLRNNEATYKLLHEVVTHMGDVTRIDHATITPSALHAPSQRPMEDCPCLTCQRTTALLLRYEVVRIIKPK